LVSSHVLTELQDLCDSIGIMREGKMVINGNLQEVVERATLTKTILMELLNPFPETHGFLIAQPNIHFSGKVDESSTFLEFTFDGGNEEVANLLRTLVELGTPVKSFHERKADVESLFLAVESGEQS
ncbi:MAG: ABC transporter ATP-binding protein, partial [Verrucomicrobiota bacterium]|nr:ABC transporter ATP-binding protein [Verrucomicrobiota bacterium]